MPSDANAETLLNQGQPLIAGRRKTFARRTLAEKDAHHGTPAARHFSD